MRKNILRNIVYTAASLALFFKLSLAGAAIITFDPVSTTGNVGSDITINIVGAGFENGTLGGGLNVSWNPAVLELKLVERTFPVVLGPDNCAFCNYNLSDAAGGLGVIDNENGTLTGLSVSNFIGAFGPDFNIAALTFNLLAPGTSTNQLSLAGNDIWIDQNFDLLDSSIQLAPGQVTVASVPLPPALLLFGSGLLGVVSFGRRKAEAA